MNRAGFGMKAFPDMPPASLLQLRGPYPHVTENVGAMVPFTPCHAGAHVPYLFFVKHHLQHQQRAQATCIPPKSITVRTRSFCKTKYFNFRK